MNMYSHWDAGNNGVRAVPQRPGEDDVEMVVQETVTQPVRQTTGIRTTIRSSGCRRSLSTAADLLSEPAGNLAEAQFAAGPLVVAVDPGEHGDERGYCQHDHPGPSGNFVRQRENHQGVADCRRPPGVPAPVRRMPHETWAAGYAGTGAEPPSCVNCLVYA